MFRRLKSKLLRQYGINQSSLFSMNALMKMAQLRELRAELATRQPNSLALAGYKVYSQNDEDGIIAAIFDRIDCNRTFLEIGLQDGTECNTLYLLQQGWRGGWIEADPGFCRSIRHGLETEFVPGAFKLIEDFVSPENIASHYQIVCDTVGVNNLAMFSLDIDGNDLQVLHALMRSGARPDVICCEYNGKFPPPMLCSVREGRGPQSAIDDYFGASLQSLTEMLELFEYGLVTCNLFGVNAFFAKTSFADRIEFHSPAEVWQPLRIYLTPYPVGLPPSLKYARDVLADFGPTPISR